MCLDVLDDCIGYTTYTDLCLTQTYISPIETYILIYIAVSTMSPFTCDTVLHA
jgi:hypothetical protein